MTDPLGQSQVIPYIVGLTRLGYQFHLLSVEKKDRLAERGPSIRAMLEKQGIRWTTLNFSSRPPVLAKFYDQWKLNRKVAAICRDESIDMVHARSYISAAAALQVTKKTGIPFLFDMRGFWVDERVDSGLWNLKNPIYRYAYRVFKKKEKRYLAVATHIISLTHKAKEELVQAYGVGADKITVIPCCADLDLFDYNKIDSKQKEELRKNLGIGASMSVLTYLGSLGGWYLTDEMLRFFSVWLKRKPDAVFLLITQDSRERVLRATARYGIPAERVRVQPASRGEVPGYLAISDWSVFFIKDAYSKKASSPTKQGEIMAMGIPIVCNDIGDTGRIVKESGTGVVVTDFTDAELEKAADTCWGRSYDPKHIRDAALQYYDLKEGVVRYERVYKMMAP